MQWCFTKTTAISAAVLVIALATAPAFAAGPPDRQRTATAVMSVEHAWLAALHRRDVKTLARILGREFIDSDFQGEAVTRAQYLAYFAHPMAHPGPRIRQVFRDTRVRFVADGNVAIATGIVITLSAATSKAEVSTNPDAIRHSRFTDVFVWRDGRWQAVSGQETHFSAPAGKSSRRSQELPQRQMSPATDLR